MNGLLVSARAIVADLVRKRLWPIAVVLVVALVAIPLLIATPSSPPATTPGVGDGVVAGVGDGAVAGVPAQPAPAAAVQEAATTPSREPGATVSDPFFDPPAGPSDDDGATKQSAAPSAGASPKTAAQTPAAKPSDAKPPAAADANPSAAADAKPPAAADAKPSSPAAKKPATPAPADSPAEPTGTYQRTAGRLAAGAATHPLARLTPIGDPARPVAVYLGVLNLGRRYAMFVLGRGTTSRGEATCAVETGCRIIGLRPGDTQTVTVQMADGHPARRYVLHVSSIQRITASAAKARALRAGVHPDGRAAVRTMSRDAAVAPALSHVGYRRATGLLYVESADVLGAGYLAPGMGG